MDAYDDDNQIEKFNRMIDDIKKIGSHIMRLESNFRNLELDMHNDIFYISKLFSIRQFKQLHAMFKLEDNENHILISRSMFEGAVYLSSFLKDNNLASNWRNYAYVVDKIRMDSSCDKNEIPENVKRILLSKQEVIDSFKDKNGKFYPSWIKGKSIKNLSEIAGLGEFYKKYYSPMSEFHHWGTKSFGIRYGCLNSDVEELTSAEIKLESLNAWCMSISSILSVLSILADYAQNDNLIKKISKLQENLSKIDGTITTKIKYV